MPITPSERVAAILRGQLEAGQIPPGGRLPPERELAQEHGVSSTTIGRAIGQLRREGLVEIRRGTGAFARARRVARVRGLDPEPPPADAQYIAAHPADARLAELLRVAAGTAVEAHRWTAYVDGRPVALYVRYARAIGSSDDVPAEPLELVVARLPTVEQAESLQITDITPVLLTTWSGVHAGGDVVVVEAVLAADRVELLYRSNARIA